MIQFVDLQTQYKKIQAEVEAGVLAVLRGGQYILGPEVRELEARLAEYAGTKFAVSCASGTDALMIALMAKGIGPGDVIFTTPFTFFATAEVIAVLGATPVFVDIDPVTFNIDPKALSAAVQALKAKDRGIHPLPGVSQEELAKLSPKGIIAVDLFGIPADYDAINAIAKQHGLFVIEDTAQGFGGKAHGKMAGALAEIGCTSFFPAKPLGCYGDGGALFTDDQEMAALFNSIRVHGQGVDKYENVRLGITGRLDSIQAAILLPKLKIFEEELAQRQRVADRYTKGIKSAGLKLVTPAVPDGLRSAWAQYSVLADNAGARQAFQDKLKEAGIPSAVYYMKPLHLQKAFAGLQYRAGDFKISEDFSERIFSLPMHPYLDDATIDRIVGAMGG
jgi:UDP-2-acetamido-2-deoxy-ribo-hexuluronate aminotransferase